MSTVSGINPIATLTYLCSAPEHQYLERKGIDEAGIKPTKLADELIGMLNADGGILVLGISDSGDIQDLKTLSESKRNDYRLVCHNLVKPPANVHLEEFLTDDGKLIFLYHVEQDYERLFNRSDTEKVFLRIADSNKGPLSMDEVDKLRYDKSIRNFEEQIRDDFDMDDLDTATLSEYREKLHFDGTDLELLVKRNLAKEVGGLVVLKNSAILLFSIDPEKYIPSSSVRYVRFEGDELLSGTNYNVTKDERFYGNIPRLIENVRKFIYASLNDYYYLDIESGRFISISEYPEDAWLEGIVNALFHRSYNLQGNCIYIKHYDDRLEISNSGPLPAQVTIDNIRHQRFSRNPRIGRVLSEMGITRELNEGVNRIYNSMGQLMLLEPVYSDSNDTVMLTLKNSISKHEKSISQTVYRKIEKEWLEFNDTERKIIGYLFSNYKATVGELADNVGVSVQAIYGNLRIFIDMDIIERHSDKKRDLNAIYMFKKA